MKNYSFTIVLSGWGDTPEEAWDAALESFVQDPGFPDEDQIEIVDEEE